MKKISIVFVSLFLLGAICIGTYLHFNLSRIINTYAREKLINTYNSDPNTNYLIAVEDIQVGIWSGTLSLSKVSFIPKQKFIALQRTMDKQIIKNTSLKITIDNIELSGLAVYKAIKNREILADKFRIESPHVLVYQLEQTAGGKTGATNVQDTLNLSEAFTNYLNSIELAHLEIADGITTYHTINELGDTNTVLEIQNLNYSMTQVSTNQETLKTKHYLSFETFDFSVDSIKFFSQVGTISLSELQYAYTLKTFSCENILFANVVTKKEFFKSQKYRAPYINGSVDHLAISNLNILQFFDSTFLSIPDLQLRRPQLQIATNMNKPFPPTKVKEMLGTIITHLSLPFEIQKLTIEDAKIDLNILGKHSPKEGHLIIDKLNVQAENITNSSELIAKNPHLRINGTTQINQTGNITTSIDIDLSDSQSQTIFNVDGSNVQMKNFNSVLSPILRISVTDGIIYKFVLRSVISSNGAKGFMDAHYENLYVSIENSDPHRKPGLLQNIFTGVANGYIKNNNIPNTKNYHVGNFQFKKTKDDSFFKMLWLVHLHGLEDSVIGKKTKTHVQSPKQWFKK